MSTEILNTYDEDSQLISELYGDNIETREEATIKRSKSVVRILEISKSLDSLLSDNDSYLIRRCLASADDDVLTLFESEMSKVIKIKGNFKKMVKSLGWNEKTI